MENIFSATNAKRWIELIDWEYKKNCCISYTPIWLLQNLNSTTAIILFFAIKTNYQTAVAVENH